MDESKTPRQGIDVLPKTTEELEQIIQRAIRTASEAKASPPAPGRKWATSNILFLVFSLFVGGLIGYFFDYFKSKQEEKTYSLQMAYNVGDNLIAWGKYARDKVLVTYKSDVGKELTVMSYYSIQGKILNAGNKKFQNLTFRFVSDKDLYLIKNPQFVLLPKQERPYLEIKQNPQIANNEDEWVFSELTPGEQIDFQYLAWSDRLFETSPKLAIVPKEPKDEKYRVSYQQKIDAGQEKRKMFLEKPLSEFTGLDLMYASVFLVAPIVYAIIVIGWFIRRRSRYLP